MSRVWCQLPNAEISASSMVVSSSTTRTPSWLVNTQDLLDLISFTLKFGQSNWHKVTIHIATTNMTSPPDSSGEGSPAKAEISSHGSSHLLSPSVEDAVATGTKAILESPHISDGPGRIANAPVPSVFVSPNEF
jgi:hypothetical protein